MLGNFRASGQNVFLWIIIILLIIGLAGFGLGGIVSSIGSRSVATVGDQEISQDAFARAIDQDMRAIAQQLGQGLTMTEARQFGIDRFTLARLINNAAFDGEAARIGVSVGDGAVQRQILISPAFRGIDGTFDREAYRFALERQGLRPSQFEETLRRELAREVLAEAISSPARVPDTAALTILGYLGERRGFDWVRLQAPGRAALPEPDEDMLRAFFEDDPDAYMRPETLQIVYAIVRPEDIAAGIDYEDSVLEAAFEAQRARFETAERRIVDRITFRTAADAEAALERIEAGEIDFDALAAERGLSADEIDQGTITATALPAEARAIVFDPDAGPGVYGPVVTPLGPALFRVNAVLPARSLSFEDVREDLRAERAEADARQTIEALLFELEDLVAGGATVETLADETAMTLERLALNAESDHPLAADAAFVQAAEAAREGIETDPVVVAGGALAVLRVDAIEEPRPLAFDEVRDRVEADWRAAERRRLMQDEAEALLARLGADGRLADLAAEEGLDLGRAEPVARSEIAPGLPPAIVGAIFEAEDGAAVVVPDGDGVVIAQLTAIVAFDPDTTENAELLNIVRREIDIQVRRDMIGLFGEALQAREGVTINESLIEGVLAQFP